MTIKLCYKERVKEFDFAHALNLLRYEVQQGVSNWKVHKDSKYKFVDNELIRKRSNRTRKKESKPKTD